MRDKGIKSRDLKKENERSLVNRKPLRHGEDNLEKGKV